MNLVVQSAPRDLVCDSDLSEVFQHPDLEGDHSQRVDPDSPALEDVPERLWPNPQNRPEVGPICVQENGLEGQLYKIQSSWDVGETNQDLCDVNPPLGLCSDRHYLIIIISQCQILDIVIINFTI